MLLESPVLRHGGGADSGGTPVTHTPFVFRNVQHLTGRESHQQPQWRLVPMGPWASNVYQLVLLFCLSALASGAVCFPREETAESVSPCKYFPCEKYKEIAYLCSSLVLKQESENLEGQLEHVFGSLGCSTQLRPFWGTNSPYTKGVAAFQ